MSPDALPRARVRVLYIGGSGRSGSTLLDRLLGQVPGLCSVGEIVHLWRRGVRDDQRCGCGEPFHDCPFWSKVGDEAFGGWDTLDLDEVLRLQQRVDRTRYVPFMLLPVLSRSYRDSLRRYAGLLGRLYQAIEQVSGAAFVVDSTKHASYAFLLRHVPEVDLQIVHLVRDPRGVAYSWTKTVAKPEITDRTEYMPRYRPTRMSLRWVSQNLLFGLLSVMGTRTLPVTYESVITDTRSTAERILRFCGKPAAPGELDHIGEGTVHLEPTHTVAGNPMRFKEGDLPLRLDLEWQQQLSGWNRRIVSLLSWPLMLRYGYRVRGRR